MKKIWMTVLGKDEATAQKVMGEVKKYGLAVDGHFWQPDLEKMEWMAPRQELLQKDVALWLIVSTAEDIAKPDTRYGLSLLAITVQASRGFGFPVVILHGGGNPPTADDLPTPLKHAQVLEGSSAYGPKLVAKANVPFKPTESPYRMDAYGLAAGLGLWIEVGPAGHNWKGVMFGVSPGEVNAHGVGQKGQLPRGKMVLNYPMEGLKVNLGDKEYNTWAVKNDMDDQTSYFVRVKGMPDSFLFGEFSEEDDAEVFVTRLI